METNTTNTVTFTKRVRANQLVRQLRAELKCVDALVIEAAIMWESYPSIHSEEELTLANALLTSEYGTEEWHFNATAIYIIIESK